MPAKYTYNGNWTVTTDPASISTRTVTDAFGRVGQFIEDYSGAVLPTYYGYDPLGDLTSVSKCVNTGCSTAQIRSFSYDGVGRLTQATNPESGTVAYAYGSKQEIVSSALSHHSAAVRILPQRCLRPQLFHTTQAP